jgi:putative ABC transport system permease protein
MAWRNLSRRKLRTGLTVAGIFVGVALILILLSLIAGIDLQVKTSIRALGGADIVVYNSTIVSTRQSFFLGSSATLNDSMLEQIGSLPNVYSVSPQMTDIFFVNETLAPIWGINPLSFDKTEGGLNIIEGKGISENEANITVLGKALYDVINASIGQEVHVRARPPNEQNNATPTIVGIYETGVFVTDRGLYMPIGIVQELTDNEGNLSSILVKADDPNNVEAISSEVTTLFPETRVVAISIITERTAQLLNSLTLFLGAIGMVALVAGSFGVINTMFISVIERTREIGTMKAIGANNKVVLKQFITEALILGCLGGLIGIVAGSFSSIIISRLSIDILPTAANIAPLLTLPNIAVSFFLGLATGAIAGFYPAWRAARMKPVEALRRV